MLKVGNLKIASKKTFKVGDTIWAKLKKYPVWPGKIVEPPAIQNVEPPAIQNTLTKLQKKKTCKSRDGHHYVYFFGSYDYDWVEDERIFPHSDEILDYADKKRKSILYSNAIEDVISETDTLHISINLMKKYKINGPMTNFFLNDHKEEEVIEAIIELSKTKEHLHVSDLIKKGMGLDLDKIPLTENFQGMKLKKGACDKKLPLAQKRGRGRPLKKMKFSKTKDSEERNLNDKACGKELLLAQTIASKPHTSNFVKRGRGRPLKKMKLSETKDSEERNLNDKACGKELLLAQTSASNSTSDDFSAPNSNALDGASDQVAIVPPLDDLVLAQKLDLYPVPPVDISRSCMALQNKYFPATSEKLGFLGLGLIGQRIVKLLLDSSHDVSVFNRTPEKCKLFVDAGAKQLFTPAELILKCDIIFCCVSGPQAVESFLYGEYGILKGLERCRPGTKSYVELTSMDPHCSRAVAEAITSKGGIYLEAAIIGSRSLAEKSSLVISCAGDRDLYHRCYSCFRAISKEFFYEGSEVGKSSHVNLSYSVLKGTANGLIAEAMALIEKMNFRKSQFLELLSLSNVTLPLYAENSQAIVENKFLTDTSIKRQQQDLSTALELSEKFELSMPLVSAANEVYKECMRRDYSEYDISAAYLAVRNPQL